MQSPNVLFTTNEEIQEEDINLTTQQSRFNTNRTRGIDTLEEINERDTFYGVMNQSRRRKSPESPEKAILPQIGKTASALP